MCFLVVVGWLELVVGKGQRLRIVVAISSNTHAIIRHTEIFHYSSEVGLHRHMLDTLAACDLHLGGVEIQDTMNRELVRGEERPSKFSQVGWPRVGRGGHCRGAQGVVKGAQK